MHADTALGDDATVIVTPARPATARGVDSLGSLGTAHRPAWQGTPLSSSAAGTGSGAYQPASHRFARHRRDGHRLQPTGWDPLTLGSIERALKTGVEPIARPMVRQAARQCADVASLTMELAQHGATEPQRQKFIAEAMAGPQATPVPTATPRTAVPGDGAVPLAAGTATETAAAAAGVTAGVPVSETDRAHALAVSSRPVPTATPRTAVPDDGAVPLAAGTATGTAAAAAGAAVGVPVSEADRAHALAVLPRHLGPIARIVVKRRRQGHQQGAADRAADRIGGRIWTGPRC